MSETVGSVCCKEECVGTEYECACQTCVARDKVKQEE
jgi:hypothetical protein